MAETSRTDPDDAPQRTRRHARAGRATRSTMGLRSAAWNIAPWLRDSLWHVLPPRFKVADIRRSIYSWLTAIYASAERDNERPQRGPQDVDPPDQRIGSAALNAMYESPDINFVPEQNHRARRIVQDPHQIVAKATDASKRKFMMPKRGTRCTALA